MDRGVLVQSAMGPQLVIVGSKLAEGPMQMRFPKHDHVVETLPPDRSRSVFPRTHSAMANLGQSAYRGCPWLVAGA